MNTFVLLATGNMVLGGMAFLLGLLILRENPRQTLNRVVAFMLFFGGLGSILAAMGFLAARDDDGTATAGPGLAQNFAYLWEFFFPTLLLFASIFPRERGFTRKFKSFPLLVYAPHAFHFLLILCISLLGSRLDLDNLNVPNLVRPLVNIIKPLFELFLAAHNALFSLVNLGYGAAGATLLIQSYRASRLPRLRKQLQVIGLGLTACLILYSFATSIPTLLKFPVEDRIRALLTVAALTVGSGSITYAMVRHKFLDAKLLVRRGILYAVASAILVGFYLTVINQLGEVISGFLSVDIRIMEPVLLIMALILFQPTIARLEERLEQLLLRDRGDYRNVLRQLGRDLLTTIDLNEMLSRSINTIGEVLLLKSAHVVAISREGPIHHRGAGPEPDPRAIDRLPGLLNRLPIEEESFRLDGETETISPEDRRTLIDDFQTSVVFPLHSKGETVGALLLGEKATGTDYTSEDVALLSTLAGQMSVSVQNGLLLRDRVAVARMEEELNLARLIQSTFLPSEFPDMPHFEVYAVNTPSREVGGDYYDLVPTNDGIFYLAIADVSGKGVPAALLTSMLQASLRTQVEALDSVSEIVSNINSLVSRSTSIEQYATFFLGRVDPGTLRMRFSNCGHNYPLVIRKNGDCVHLEKGGMVVGMFDTSTFEEDTVDLSPGDRIVFYTDGVNEAFNKNQEDYGEERLESLVQSLSSGLSAKEMTDRILADLYGFLEGEEPQDDVTVMVLRVLETDPAEKAKTQPRLAADPA